MPKSKSTEFQPVEEVFSGFKSYTMSVLPGDLLKIKMVIDFDSSQLGSYWQAFLSCPGLTNASLKFVPHNVMAYQWAGCYDFQNSWTRVREDLQSSQKAQEGIQKWKQRFEKRFKVNIYNDVLPMLGSELGGYLNDVDTQGLFPYPRGVLFIKIQNRLKVEEVIAKLTKNPLALLQREEYGKSSISYVTFPLGANMDPGYTFLGDYLLVGSSRQLLKASIDAFNNPNQSFQSKEVLSKFGMNTSELSQGMAFFKIEDIARRLQQLLDWYNKIVSSQITTALSYQQETAQNKIEMEILFKSNKDELIIAEKKLNDLRSKEFFQEATEQEKAEHQVKIEHLNSEIKLLQEDINAYENQKEELKQIAIVYQNQAESAKSWLFLSDEVFMPILRSLEGLQALGVKWYLNGPVSETEMFIQ
jgi:hypothetical protein